MSVRDLFFKARAKKLQENLKRRNFGCDYFDTKEEAKTFILSQIIDYINIIVISAHCYSDVFKHLFGKSFKL